MAGELLTARCIVITGADPAFCSGDDVKQILSKTGDGSARPTGPLQPQLTPAADALLHTDVPVIAAVSARPSTRTGTSSAPG